MTTDKVVFYVLANTVLGSVFGAAFYGVVRAFHWLDTRHGLQTPLWILLIMVLYFGFRAGSLIRALGSQFVLALALIATGVLSAIYQVCADQGDVAHFPLYFLGYGFAAIVGYLIADRMKQKSACQ